MAVRVPVAERRAQLVRAAVRVMLRDGVGAATTRAIAAEAGVTLAILHYCFETKADLLRLAYTTVLDETVHELSTTPRRGPRPAPAERVEHDLMLTVLAAEDDPGPIQLLHEFDHYALRRRELSDLPVLRRETARRSFTAYVERVGRESGLVWDAPAGEVADAMTVLLDGVVVSWLVERDTDRARTQVRRFVAELLRRSAPAALV